MSDSAHAQLVRQAARWLPHDKGTVGHDSTQTPFGISSTDQAPLIPGEEGNSGYIARVAEVAMRASWPPMLKYAYMALGHAEREFQKEGWVFSALERIEKRQTLYEKNGQTRVCDLAVQYEGMGHFLVLCLDTRTGKLFKRLDGGGNDYERAHHWEFAKSLDPSVLGEEHFCSWDPQLPVQDLPVAQASW